MSEIQENKTQNDQVRQPSTEIKRLSFSWRWFFGGLFFLLLAGGTLGGLYYARSAGMPSHILTVVQKMTAESETLKAEGKIRESLQIRRDAANLLNRFNQTHQGIFEIQKELNTILESLYVDEGKMASLLGETRNKQIIDNCNQLITTLASDKESLPYRIRLMELEWDRQNLVEVLRHAKNVLRIERTANDRENYEALRIITLIVLSRLPVERYDPAALGDSSFPEQVDVLLDKVYRMKPADIEIAYRYAGFIINVNNPLFLQNSSEKLRGTSEAERRQMANSIIDDMVGRNANKAGAYLARYRFRNQQLPSPSPDEFDPDLNAALKIEPTNPEILLLAGLYALRQSDIARRSGDTERAEERKKTGEEFLYRNAKENPFYGLAYQYLGDYLSESGKPAEAVQVWKKGFEIAAHPAMEELIGRLVLVSTETKQFEQARAFAARLDEVMMDARLRRPGYVTSIRNISTLLNANILVEEGRDERVRAENAQIAGKMEESRRLYTAGQKNVGDALIMLDRLLENFGSSVHDYVVSPQSIYAKLLPGSLMLAGELMADQYQWDRAAKYFESAIPFASAERIACSRAAEAYRQSGQPAKGVDLLEKAAAKNPNDLTTMINYTRALFRYQIGRSDVDVQALDLLEKNLNSLNERRDELSVPWRTDVYLVLLKLERASITNSLEKILEAQIAATQEFRALENKEFPKPKDGTESEKKIYSDDILFLRELAGNYSLLAALSDFDRILVRMRELPGGENAYFAERLNDAARRNDKEGAMIIIDEAINSPNLTVSQKQPFIKGMQTMKSDQSNFLDRTYETLRKSYDHNPDSLKPQAFFALANWAIDRNDLNYAKALRGRLEKIEGAPERGTWWRYIEARILLSEQIPPYDRCRKLQEEIAAFRPDWDLAYKLRANIEEKYLMENPTDEVAKEKIIESLQSVIRCGSTETAMWNRLLSLYEADQRTEDAKKLRRDAMIRAIVLDTNTGQFPQPYQRMFVQVNKYIQNSDPINADITAKQCIALAEGRREDPSLIYALNLAIGQAFFDAELLDNAQLFLEYVARRGASHVFPLAMCLVQKKQVDEGFTIVLDEIDRTPSSQATLLPSLLVLLGQVRPSEEIFNRIDKLMLRIENGERQTLRGEVEESDEEGAYLPLGTRRLRSLLLRFPEKNELMKTDGLEIFPSEEGEIPEVSPKPDTAPIILDSVPPKETE